MLHTTPEKVIGEALEDQAQRLSGSSWVMLVDDRQTAITGNLMFPRYLWLCVSPDDNLKGLQGLNVAIHPSSEESRKRWEAQGIGKVLSVIPDPLILVDSVLNLNNR